jgi:hypothetical protein
LSKNDNAWGSFVGRAQIDAPGEWKLSASIAGEGSETVETTLLAQSVEWEKTGQPARPEVLEEMARIAQGRMISPESLSDLVKEITALPEPRPRESRVALWQHGAVIGTMIFLAALFWIARKWNGQI